MSEIKDLRSPNHFRDFLAIERQTFFGHNNLPPSLPPLSFVEMGAKLRDMGFDTFEPVAFPELSIPADFAYPANWKRRLDPWLYREILQGSVGSSAIRMNESWGWLDASKRPEYDGGRQVVGEDIGKPMGRLIGGFRLASQLNAPPEGLHPESRFWITPFHTEMKLYKALAELIGIDSHDVVSLRAVEFNYLGNMRYPHFAAAGTVELFQDGYVFDEEKAEHLTGNPDLTTGRLFGGNSNNGGLSYIDSDSAVTTANGRASFRPLVKVGYLISVN